jgi:hypothetical protein
MYLNNFSFFKLPPYTLAGFDLTTHSSNLKPAETIPGANPTIASYNASVVNFYNATGSLARFEKNYLLL